MLCKSCRRQISRSDSVCGACGAPIAGRAPLELVVGDGRRIPLSAGPLSIGRGTDNLIRIESETVSRHHARILVKAGRPSVEDAGSTYGTFVDGQKVAGRRALRDGDVVRLGDVELHIEVRRDERDEGRTVVFGAIPGLPDEDGAALRFPRLRAGTKLKRLEADEGDLRFVLRGPDGHFVRLTAGDAELLQLLDGRTSLASLITAAAGRFGPDGRAAWPRSSQTWASAACSRASRRPSRRRRSGWSRGCSGRGSRASPGWAPARHGSTEPAGSSSSRSRCCS